MKVSDRIKELRKSLANATIDTVNRYLIERQLNQLVNDVAEALRIAKEEGFDIGDKSGKKHAEAEAAGALQAAKQEGWDAGYRWQCIEQLETDKGGHKAALQEAKQEGYLNGYGDGYSSGYEDGAGYRQ